MTEPKTYLITGGSGFLGINLIRYLLARGHTIKSLDIVDFDYPERDQITVLKMGGVVVVSKEDETKVSQGDLIAMS